MIWILATKGAATRLREAPFSETAIEGVHSVVYKPGVEPVAHSGGDVTDGVLGTFRQGMHRASGFVFTFDGSAAETLFGLADPIDLIIRYRSAAEVRKRTLSDVIFVGDAAVAFPSKNSGVSELIGVPFRVQIPIGETLSQHLTDEAES